jgi:hypothetical protein
MATNRSWDEEDSWWRNNFSSRPYGTGRNYDEFRPAYQYGYESGLHHTGRMWSPISGPAGRSSRAGVERDPRGTM